MLEFCKAFDNDECVEHIQQILLSCGNDMYEKHGLTHWLRPYSKENIKNDILCKNVFVVKDDTEYIATFTVMQCKEDCIYVSKLAVKPECAGQGIGRQCMDFIEKFALERNIHSLRLDVYDKSRHAIDFYLKQNFSVTGERPTTNFRVLLMEKILK